MKSVKGFKGKESVLRVRLCEKSRMGLKKYMQKGILWQVAASYTKTGEAS